MAAAANSADAARTPVGAPEGGYDPMRQMLVRAAWLYYVEGQTQEQIARHLGVNRVRVNRMLATARAEGIVRVNIEESLAGSVRLELALKARYGLKEVVVVPAPVAPDNVRRLVAHGAGQLLSERLQPDMVLGVGWGRTLRTSLEFMPARPIPGLKVVSLTGGLTHGSVMNSYEIALRLADHFGASCSYIAGPAFADSEESRDMLLRQPMLVDALAQAAKAEMAYISVGGIDPQATMLTVDLVSADDIASLRRAGAVGDILGHWIDAEGRIVDHDFNRRVLALSPERLADIPNVILATGGVPRAAAMKAALRRDWIDTLVTDEITAGIILGEET